MAYAYVQKRTDGESQEDCQEWTKRSGSFENIYKNKKQCCEGDREEALAGESQKVN